MICTMYIYSAFKVHSIRTIVPNTVFILLLKNKKKTLYIIVSFIVQIKKKKQLNKDK